MNGIYGVGARNLIKTEKRTRNDGNKEMRNERTQTKKPDQDFQFKTISKYSDFLHS